MVDATTLRRIDTYISEGCTIEAVALLESLAARAETSAVDELSLGLLLMMPPFGDYEAASCLFRNVAKNIELEVEACVWGMYLFITLLPVHDDFAEKLEMHQRSPEALLMLARHALWRGDMVQARKLAQKSVMIEPFPYNLLVASRCSRDEDAKRKLIEQAKALVQMSNMEQSPRPTSRSALLEKEWAELIRGDVMTSIVWHHTFE